MPLIERKHRSTLFIKTFKGLVLLVVFICRIPVATAQDERLLPQPAKAGGYGGAEVQAIGEKAKEAAGAYGEKAKEVVSGYGEKAKEVVKKHGKSKK